jgi:hypothetical protein
LPPNLSQRNYACFWALAQAARAVGRAGGRAGEQERKIKLKIAFARAD